MSKCVENKIALVTGGASGIGYQFTQELINNGIKGVMIADVNEVLGQKAVNNFGNKVRFIKTNVCSEDDYENAFKKTIATFGRIDIVINNAGILNEESWLDTININVAGVTRGTQLGYKYMGKDRNGQGGTIINTSSIAGLEVIPIAPTYTASKHYVTAYVRAVGTPFYFKNSGVRVMALCPGLTDTAILQNINASLIYTNQDQYIKDKLKDLPFQRVEVVGKALIDVLEKGENGSCWMVDDGKPAILVDWLKPVRE